MKYTPEERLRIGQQVYDGELSKYQASERYGISVNSARDYMRLYRDANGLPPKSGKKGKGALLQPPSEPKQLEDYEAMTREELIDALVTARINEARLKKGYLVKGAGAKKEFIRLILKNTK